MATITTLPGIVQQFEVNGKTYTKLPGIVQEFPFGTVLPGIVQQFEIEDTSTLVLTQLNTTYFGDTQDGWFPVIFSVTAPNGVESCVVEYYDCTHGTEIPFIQGQTLTQAAVRAGSLDHKPEDPYFTISVKQKDDDTIRTIRVDLDYKSGIPQDL